MIALPPTPGHKKQKKQKQKQTSPRADKKKIAVGCHLFICFSRLTSVSHEGYVDKIHARNKTTNVTS
jgi:hypothetical protein